MRKQRKQSARQRLHLSLLRHHPAQASYYDACTSADDEALLADLEANGQRDPVVVIPIRKGRGRIVGYQILDGHRRVRLLMRLGKEHVNAIVRHELADADDATIEREFLQFNFLRRQLDTIDKAAIARRLYELNRGAPLSSGEDQTDAREHVGAMIGMSGRNLDRYWRMLRTPRAVQVAFRDGFLKLIPASQIAGLSPNDQEELAKQITAITANIREAKQAGDKAEAHRLRRELTQAVESRVGEQVAADRTHVSTFRRLTEAIHRLLPGMPNVIKQINSDVIRDHLPDLCAMRDVLDRLIRSAGESRRSR